MLILNVKGFLPSFCNNIMAEAGVLCHITSLPSGKLGPDAFTFVDILAETGVSIWKILPITPPDENHNPHFSTSAFAGSVKLCDPSFEEDPDHQLIRDWLSVNAHWAWDWALYDVLKQLHDERPWYEWPQPLREREPGAIQEAIEQYMPIMRGRIMNQVRFQRDWMILRHYATQNGIQLCGQVPISIAKDSVDVWVRPHLFREDIDHEDVTNELISHHWSAHQDDGWTWWQMRMSRASGLFDFVELTGSWSGGHKQECLTSIAEVVGENQIIDSESSLSVSVPLQNIVYSDTMIDYNQANTQFWEWKFEWPLLAKGNWDAFNLRVSQG